MIYVIQVCWQLASMLHVLHVSDSSSFHHQEIFTVRTAMIYVIQVCWQLASMLHVLHVSDSSSFHHQEFFTVRTTMKYVIRVCWQLASRLHVLNVSDSSSVHHQEFFTVQDGTSSVLILLASCQQTCMTYTFAVCAVKNSWWWTEKLSETCRVLSQN